MCITLNMPVNIFSSCYNIEMENAVKKIPHTLPLDLRKEISKEPKVAILWQDITPLARNEWICWVISGKKAETRYIRIKKAISKMKGGMRRPCCWAGCTHR